MLYRMENVRATPVITGLSISRGGKSKSRRAALAAQVILGERELDQLTQKQLAKLFGVSLRYITRAIELDPGVRREMAAGWIAIAEVPSVPTDDKLRKMVRAAGVERTWDALVMAL